jgi:CheY-like chemotaxis protein
MKSGYKVLLVEDNEDDAFFFSRAFKGVTKLHLVWRASGGNEAIDYLAGNQPFADRCKYPYPDVLVLDLKMPARDGFNVLEWLDQQQHRPAVCVYSGSDETRDIDRAKALHAECFLSKDFGLAHFNNLLSTIERDCDRSHNRLQGIL